MKTVQQIFVCALLAALTALALAAMRVVNGIPGEIGATRAALIGEAEATRRDLNGQLRNLTARSERQVAALRSQTLAEVDQIRQTADRRLGDTLARADVALGTLEAARQDLNLRSRIRRRSRRR